MTTQLIPARIITPGRILSRELEARGWTQKDLAEIMDRPTQTINAIVKAKKEITPETAIELAAAFDISPEFWTNLENNYRLHLAQKKHSNNDDAIAKRCCKQIARRRRLYELVPIAELTKRQWLPNTNNLEELEKAVCDFLDISSPIDTPKLAVNFRLNSALEPENTAFIAWIKRVEHLLKNQTLGTFNRENFKLAIPEILNYAESVENIAKIPSLLISLGIHFIIVPHLPRTYLDGATFMLDNHPVIAMTLRYNRLDSFWFTLMHELGHIYAGHEGVYLDDLQHLEDNPEETEANKLSCNWLISQSALAEFIEVQKNKFSTQIIEQFAESQKRHPGIVVGRLQYDQVIPYENHRKYLVKIDKYLTPWCG